jgi:hypothetical protein
MYCGSADAQLEDSGAYMCQLNTDPMRFKMGHLNVVITPDIVHIQGPGVVVEGGTARLECEARGEPSPLVFWQRENSREMVTILDRKDGKRRQMVRVDGPVLEMNKVRHTKIIAEVRVAIRFVL